MTLSQRVYAQLARQLQGDLYQEGREDAEETVSNGWFTRRYELHARKDI